jgi:Ca2+-binding RTX toxin-like protein
LFTAGRSANRSTIKRSDTRGRWLSFANQHQQYSDRKRAEGLDLWSSRQRHRDGGAGNDYLFRKRGSGPAVGGEGNDQLYGGAGLDTLNGGNGNDVLDGSGDAQADVLDVGAGDDSAQVWIGDSALGGDGIDTLTVFQPFSMNSQPARFVLNFSKIHLDTAQSIGFGGITAGQFEGAFVLLSDVLAGTRVTGSIGDDVISGGFIEATGSGGVSLSGFGGDDSLVGSNKNDVINGGTGTDQIEGGEGADTLTGGTGQDLFQVVLEPFFFPGQPPQAVDTITDFAAAQDFFLIGGQGFASVLDIDPRLRNADQSNPLEAGSAPTATSAQGQFLYDTDDGRLLFDADGTGSQAAIHLFTLTGLPVLTDSNFIFDL